MSQIAREGIVDRLTRGESLRGVNLVRADLTAMEMVRADLAEVNLRMADLSRADLTEARLTGSFLSGATLSNAVLLGANLVEASIIGAILKEANLSRADLSGADLTGANLRDTLLVGAYLVGTFLNETDLAGANMTGAYIRMAQMSGSNLSGATLESADLSHADLSGVRLNGCCLVGANLTGANLSASSLTDCDLRGANLTDADLTGCNLTGAKLYGIKFDGIRMDDAWAEWINIGANDRNEERALLEEVFVGIIGKPLLQVLVEGRVGDDVWATVLAHLCDFQATHQQHSGLRLKAVLQGVSSSALYIEADREQSLAAYLAEFVSIAGKGSDAILEKIASFAPVRSEQPDSDLKDFASNPLSLDFDTPEFTDQPQGLGYASGRTAALYAQSLRDTAFWTSDKAFAILTGSRRIWLEAASSEGLTLRPPHAASVGMNLIGGRFVADDSRRNANGKH